MWSFNDSSEETLFADCLALSVFSLNTELHQTVVYTHTDVLYPTGSPHTGTVATAHTSKFRQKKKKNTKKKINSLLEFFRFQHQYRKCVGKI